MPPFLRWYRFSLASNAREHLSPGVYFVSVLNVASLGSAPILERSAWIVCTAAYRRWNVSSPNTAVTRLLPGVLGDAESAQVDSFSQGLLEYPQYTRPADFRGMKVPEVLLSGNHAEIAGWEAEQARMRTVERRPDLLEEQSEGVVE